jgi:hypothetical protein
MKIGAGEQIRIMLLKTELKNLIATVHGLFFLGVLLWNGLARDPAESCALPGGIRSDRKSCLVCHYLLKNTRMKVLDSR